MPSVNNKMRGGKKAKNPMKTFGRLLKFIFKHYWIQLIIVFLCMAVTSFASVYGASFPSKVVATDSNGVKTFFEDYVDG